jgi:hypothetical protein
MDANDLPELRFRSADPELQRETADRGEHSIRGASAEAAPTAVISHCTTWMRRKALF